MVSDAIRKFHYSLVPTKNVIRKFCVCRGNWIIFLQNRKLIDLMDENTNFWTNEMTHTKKTKIHKQRMICHQKLYWQLPTKRCSFYFDDFYFFSFFLFSIVFNTYAYSYTHTCPQARAHKFIHSHFFSHISCYVRWRMTYAADCDWSEVGSRVIGSRMNFVREK